MTGRQGENRSIISIRLANEPGLGMLSGPHEKRGEHRHQGKCQHQRSDQRENNRQSHGSKHLAFNAFKREDRQINDNDDSDRKEDRSQYFPAASKIT